MASYFDHNASTPIFEAVLAEMLPFLRSEYGNPSSSHELGRRAREALGQARERVAAAVGVQPSQVLFTGSGSEANNLFLKGVAAASKPALLMVSAIEHPSVMKAAESLSRSGWWLEKLPVSASGALDFSALEQHPTLVSAMLANNETGAILDVGKIAACTHAAWVHTDAVQAFGKIPVDFKKLAVHALTLSAHKINGPKGAGALIVDKKLPLYPLIDGGGQERGLRSGTENVAAIVGFGAASELAVSKLFEKSARLSRLRDELESALVAAGAVIFSLHAPRIPNTCFFAYPGIAGEALVTELDRRGFMLASGAACSKTASATLLAMGVEREIASCAVRLSLGEGNTSHEIGEFVSALKEALSRLRR